MLNMNNKGIQLNPMGKKGNTDYHDGIDFANLATILKDDKPNNTIYEPGMQKKFEDLPVL